MATAQVTIDTPITLKLQCGNENKRTRLPLKDLVPGVLPARLRALLALPAETQYVFERFSDSAGSFIKLDDSNPSVYKQLHRAAKAKLKLRIRVTPVPAPNVIEAAGITLQDRAQDIAEGAAARLAELHITSQPVVAAAPLPSSLLTETTNESAQTNDQRTSTSQQDQRAFREVSSQIRGLNNYLNDFRANMAQDYSSTFGAQLPSFLDAPAEPEMPKLPSPPFNLFSVCCNNCNFAIPDHHYHCGICQEGDFDLCQQCMDEGNHCSVPDHFLVKRYVENGQIVSSTTETIAKPVASDPVPEPVKDVMNEVPGAFSSIQEDFAGFPVQSSRTCNSCISIYDDSQFVTCKDCDDYDLCLSCHLEGAHGHHPAHAFAPATDDMILEDATAAACEPGRGVYHNAICDGCDHKIYGVRNKCLVCPDFDYCSGCYKNVDFIHAGHRFVPIYEPLQVSRTPLAPRHYGIRCDGPLCGHGNYIVGPRYKCAICHDTDFCANCEALPTNPHNRTHPLIKFASPVRGVNVETREEPMNGGSIKTYGDRSTRTSSRGTETIPRAPSAHASTQAEAPAPKQERYAIPQVARVESVNERCYIADAEVPAAPARVNERCFIAKSDAPAASAVNERCYIANPEVPATPAVVNERCYIADPQAPAAPPRASERRFVPVSKVSAAPACANERCFVANPEVPAAPAVVNERCFVAPPVVSERCFIAEPEVPAVPAVDNERCYIAVPEAPAAPAVPDAYYVRDYVPDGTRVLPGKPVFQTWTMYNPSGNVWPAGSSLKWVGGDQMLDVDQNVPGRMSTYENAASSNATISPIPRGAEYSFSVKLRAPEKLGRAVSYWRLYTPDGTPFGHRLWCDVEVVSSLSEANNEPDEPVVEKKLEVESEVKPEATEELSESQMVFPRLEKESPASSTHIAAPEVKNESAIAPSSPIIAEEDEELLSHDDVESVTVDLEIDDDETTDDGFLTDEEYDMVEEELHH